MPAKKGSKNTGNKAARIQWLLDNPDKWVGWPYGNPLSARAISKANELVHSMKLAGLYSLKYNSTSLNLIALVKAAETIRRHVINGYRPLMPSKYLKKQHRENLNATRSGISAQEARF